MPRSYINGELRRLVAQRAGYSCEYCLIAEENTPSCQVDHIISVKHGGDSTAENLCYACLFCNLQKGTDLGSINGETANLSDSLTLAETYGENIFNWMER